MAMHRPIRVAQFGLGAIGLATARLVKSKKSLHLVGAVDADKSKHGKTGLGVPVFQTLGELLQKTKAEVVLHTTGSRLATVTPQILEVVNANLPCISSSEELFFPIASNKPLAKKIDVAARRNEVAVAGTGVNPGFVMDLLPIILSSTCQRIRHITIKRIVDVSTRRIQLQRKVGVGLTAKEFDRLKGLGKMGHVGLRESALFVANALGWKLDSIKQVLSPVSGRSTILGIHESIHGKSRGREVLTLELKMAVDVPNPRDEIMIDGDPALHMMISGGIRGDQATAAILVNTIPLVLRAEPGLRLVLELGVPRMPP
jgi:4-hydroxy-tetrahydrodipicolinate reductase